MTGGTEWRSTRAKSWSELSSGRKSSVIEGKIDLGKVPPPIFDVALPIVIFTGNPWRRVTIAAARARNSSFGICKSASAGISLVTWLR